MRKSRKVSSDDIAFWVYPKDMDFKIPRKYKLKKRYSDLTIERIQNLNKGNFISRLRSTNLHEAIGPTLFTAQLFGLMPISGVLSKNHHNLKFRWFAWRTLISLIVLFGSGVMCILATINLAKFGVTFYNNTTLVFSVSTFASIVLFLRLACRWPKLLGKFLEADQKMGPAYGNMPLGLRMSLLTGSVLIPSLVEFYLSINSNYSYAKKCAISGTILEEFFKVSFPEVYMWNGNNIKLAAMFQILNIATTFTWNYTDLFIILITAALTQKFKQLNKRLEQVKYKEMSVQFWRNIREDYVLLSELVKTANEIIGPIILISFSNNLYFICSQLLKGVTRSNRDKAQAFYFWFSFMLLMTRTFAVSLFSAEVAHEARRPEGVMRTLPSTGYSQDAQRFLDHVAARNVQLSGMHFFYISRRIMLTVAGTIITYELVLIQFNLSDLKNTRNYCHEFNRF
ncbi:gustatory receptor for sugar taste 64f-like [Ctenocephalides felis]|uniref:gustatory receptor for sugar taste 64f-like n=1 Tax=Ctenocephalides felis TaxID=7515 RepID=UPI000E6E239E|nr:gustatory receptor for sugar taste 64f-like [Ctenocephalides felis]